MPSLKDIRRRIGSIKSTRQTTRAMKMVAAAKLRRSQDAIVNARPYAEKINEVVSKIASTHQVTSKFFPREKTFNKELVVVVSSDRGLCGGFNASISRAAYEYIKTSSNQIEIVSVGKKAGDYLKRRGFEPKKVILNLVKEISFDYVDKLGKEIIESYFSENYDKVTFFYNEFKSALSQIPTAQTVLPVCPKDDLWEKNESKGFSRDYIFEPNPDLVMENLLEKSIVMQIYKCFLESLASEHGARMNSMENATKNAGELIRKLTLTYNNLRQAAITKELIEITSGAEAL